MVSQQILITDFVHPVLPEKLQKAGYSCDQCPDITRSELLKKIHAYTGLIVRSKIKADRELMDKAKKLRFIGRLGSGMENIDIEYAGKKKIRCFNSPEGNRDAVAEHALGMLLCLLNKLPLADKEVRQGHWRREENTGIEIKGKTIGLIGYGHTGSAFARKISGFEAHVIAYDKYKKKYSGEFVKEKKLKDLFAEADILSLHVPLTNETHYMMNDEFINQFRKNFFLINTSRGPVVKTTDLVKNLKSGKIRGAALDVLEYEKTSFSQLDNKKNFPPALTYLIQSDRVILSPHIAGWTEESYFKLADVLADKIINDCPT